MSEPSQLKPPKLSKIPPARITVVEHVYHQVRNHPPTMTESRYGRPLKSDEQVYSRRLKVGEEWQPLCPGGWLDEVSLIVIKNEEGVFRQMAPTAEQIAEAEARVLLISDGNSDAWIVSPRESMRGCPSNFKGLLIRCEKGEAHYTVTLFPR